MSVNSKMTAIANATRALDGSTAALTLDGIASKLGTEKTNIAAALAAIEEKGVEVPTGSTSDALASLIASIEAGGGGAELTKTTGSITPSSDTNTITITHGLGKTPCYFDLKISGSSWGDAPAPTTTTAKRYIPLVIYFNGETRIVYAIKSGSTTLVTHFVVDNAATVDENNITFTIPNKSGMTSYCNFYGTNKYYWEAHG